MEFYQLKSFVTVAETGSLTQAAARLFTSQPSISAHIKALEEECGFRLFKRIPQGVKLTSDGAEMLARAQAILSLCADFDRRAQSLRSAMGETLRLGVNNSAEVLRLPKIVDELSRLHPQLGFAPRYLTSLVARDLVLSEDLDIAFCEGSVADPLLETMLLTTLKIRIMAPAAWADELNTDNWRVLEQKPWVFMSSMCSYFQIMTSLAEERGLNLQKRFETDGDFMTLHLVRDARALSLVPELQLQHVQNPEAFYVWPHFHYDMPLHLIWRLDRRDEPLIRTTRDIVAQAWE